MLYLEILIWSVKQVEFNALKLPCVFPNTIIHQIFENGKTRSLLFSPLGATNGLEISRLG